VCSELTKRYEFALRGAAREVNARLKAMSNVEKGEYCAVIALPPPEIKEEVTLTAAQYMLGAMLGGAELDEAARMAGEIFARNEIYRAKLDIKKRFEVK
jgi:16S rRNA C1402 (ribose-2'-O) methylase RsmI